MTRSERLYKEGICEVFIYGTIEKAYIVKDLSKLRYVCTDFDALVNGKDAQADIYEDDDYNLYAVVKFY